MIVPPKYARLAKAVDELDARVAPKQCKFLRVIVPAGEDQAQVIERAFPEHIAAHPADAKCTVNDFIWIIRAIAAQPGAKNDDAPIVDRRDERHQPTQSRPNGFGGNGRADY
jgi:hypothetical protein